jgi:predicted transposase YdaD
VFSRPKAAAIELRQALPPAVLAELDLDTLALESSAHARPSRGPLDSDLLFSVRLRGPEGASIHVSLDHQSGPDPLFPWRTFVYTGEVWGRYIRAHTPPRPRQLPFVLPVLIAQYPARNVPTRLSDILALPERVREAFGAPFEAHVHVGDLRRSVLDDPVADPGHLALVEITRTLLYAYRNPGAIHDPRLATLGPLFDTVLDSFGPLEVEELLSYVVHVFGEDSPIFAIIMDTLGKAVKEVYVTVADKLRAEGRKEGRKEGRSVARAEALLRLLDHRMGPVSESLRARVLATPDESLLQRWFDRALVAASLDEVFQPLDG